MTGTKKALAKTAGRDSLPSDTFQVLEEISVRAGPITVTKKKANKRFVSKETEGILSSTVNRAAMTRVPVEKSMGGLEAHEMAQSAPHREPRPLMESFGLGGLAGVVAFVLAIGGDWRRFDDYLSVAVIAALGVTAIVAAIIYDLRK